MTKRIVQVGGKTVATDGQGFFLVIRRSKASGGAYEALAKAIDEQHAGSFEWLEEGVPIQSASLRLEARIAPFMTQDWLRHTGSAWEDVASTLANAAGDENEGGAK